ncbi:MAG: DUF3999 family protein [Planctomycetota bacterium]
MTRRPIAAMYLVLAAAVACGGGEAGRFQYVKNVVRPEPPEEQILAVELDSDVYAGVGDDFADLRVLDADGGAVPYRLQRATETRTETLREPSPSRVVSLVENDDNSIEVVVALNKDAPPADGLKFFTPLANFERRVSVFGSSDGDDWTPLVTDAAIFDYSRYMDVTNCEVPLPENRHRRYRVVIAEVTDVKESTLMELTRRFEDDDQAGRTERLTLQRRPFRIDRIEPWHDVTRERVEENQKTGYPIVDFSTAEDEAGKQTIVTVRTRGEPVTSFTIQTPDANFSRAASVRVPVERGVRTDWVEVGGATLLVVRFRGFAREELEISFPEQRQEEYRIVIENDDNPPLEIAGVEAAGNVHRALFFAEKGADYRIAYGSEVAEKPVYDTAALSIALGEGYRPALATLGPQSPNPEFGRGPPLRLTAVLNNPIFLTAAITLMVLVLALLLYRAGRRVEEMPSD